MKIGIITFWWSSDNYGQLLQCYALQKYLHDLGHDVFLIRYKYSLDITKQNFVQKLIKALNPVRLFRYSRNKIRNSFLRREYKNFDRHFNDFRNKYFSFSEFEYKSFDDLHTNPPDADAYIVGSDQVWNNFSWPLSRYKKPVHTYFLDFGDSKIKRISYAASWGKNEILPEYIKEIVPLLKKFDYISVREKSGVEICQQCGRDDAEWVCDPTLLLRADTYRLLYKENEIQKPSKRYILLYMLNNSCNFNIQTVYDYANLKSLEVVYITGNGVIDKREKRYATIPEWLCLVDNAEYVITNSFHCGVFCTIFHKQFGIIQLIGKNKGMNSRFESLFSLRGVGNRYISDNDFSVLDTDYEVKPVNPSKRFIEVLNCQFPESR